MITKIKNQQLTITATYSIEYNIIGIFFDKLLYT